MVEIAMPDLAILVSAIILVFIFAKAISWLIHKHTTVGVITVITDEFDGSTYTRLTLYSKDGAADINAILGNKDRASFEIERITVNAKNTSHIMEANTNSH